MSEPKVFAGMTNQKSGKYSFSEEKRTEIFRFAIQEIRKYSECKIAFCKESAEVWDRTGLEKSWCSCVCQLDYVNIE
jgi:spore photoproduct lyase